MDPEKNQKLLHLIKKNCLPYLPAKALVRFRAVSKDWDQRITAFFFAHTQSNYFQGLSGFFVQDTEQIPDFVSLNPSAACGVPDPSFRFLPEPVHVKSTCNGLVCCLGRQVGKNAYYMCNPVNKQWKELPRPVQCHEPDTPSILIFEPEMSQFEPKYKLILPYSPDDGFSVRFEIYSSDTNSWRDSEAECAEIHASDLDCVGFHLNGLAYWKTSSHQILALDVMNKVAGILSVAPLRNMAAGVVLTEMKGELCLIQAYGSGNCCTIDIYSGTEMSLKPPIAVNVDEVGILSAGCWALPCINSEKLMIVAGETIISYCMRDQKTEVIGNLHHNCEARYFPYVNSLVSLTYK